jgi:putative tricarboxylic transport membrane protein
MNVRNCAHAVGLTILVALAGAGAQASAGWRPEQPVEVIVNCAPGCGPDKSARLMQRIFQTGRYFDTSVSVMNKPGGGGAIAQTYLNQFEGNGHYMFLSGKSVLTTHAMGRVAAPYTELTPITHLFGEFIGIAVKVDSPIQSGRDLIERLRKDPTAHSFGIATSLGNTNHQGAAGALKAAGVDIRKMRTVVFQSGALAITAMLGGHIDVVPVSVGSWVSHMKNGTVRVIAVSSPQRLPGFFSEIPTWREQGGNSVVSNWRGIFGPKNMTPPQLAFWEGAMQRLLDSPDWKEEMSRIHGMTEYMGSARTRKFMEQDYAEIKAFLTELELVKK